MATLARKTWIAGIAVLTAFFFALLLIAVQPAHATHDNSKVKLDLKPPSATNTVGEQHCVTATVRQPGHEQTDLNGVPIVFSVSGANPTATSVTVPTVNGEATFCYTGTNAGEDVITAFADTNKSGTLDNDEPSAFAKKTYKPGPPTTVTITPAADTNKIGEEHCVTATVEDKFGNPISGATLVFKVEGANPTGPIAKTTDTNGQATFCYTGAKAGLDTITAFVDKDNDKTLDVGEVAGTATKTYTSPAPTNITITPAVKTNVVGQEHCVTGTATDAAGNPVAGVPIVFSVKGANTAGGTVTTNAEGKATFCYTGTKVGLDLITAYADTNKNASQDLLEPVGAATKTYLPGAPKTVTLKPPASENTVGTQHCVTAHVEDRFGNPTPGITVQFSVTGIIATEGTSVKTSKSGLATTDQQGNARFCYTSELPGENVIKAYADSDNSGTQDVGEPSDTATKTYVLPQSTPNCEITIHDGGWILAPSGGKGTFGGNAQVDANRQIVKGSQEYTDHSAGLHVKSTEILAVVCEGNSATIYGVANVTAQLPLPSGIFPFRVRVTDMGEPGSQPGPDKYGILVGNGYYSGDQPLQGGNVQVR